MLKILACIMFIVILTASFSGISLITVNADSVTVLPTDANIKYFGRWDKSDTSDYKSNWPAAYFKVNFTGTTVKIILGSANYVNIYAKLDGIESYYENVKDTVDLTSTPLSSGEHRLIVACYLEFSTFEFKGLQLDQGASTAAPKVSSTVIEYIGDSITAGYKLTHQTIADYSWLAAEKLGYEHTHIAASGIPLCDAVDTNGNPVSGMSTQFFKTLNTSSSSDWDFSRYQASIVVINIGTNDTRFNTPDSTFQNTYATFLQNIRTKYPSVTILALKTFNGYYADQTKAAVDSRKSAGDDNVYYIDTTGWTDSSYYPDDDSWHPDENGHIMISRTVAPVIESFLSAYSAQNTVISDDLNDWSKIYAHTSNLMFDTTNTSYFEGDASRLVRTADSPENIVYYNDGGISNINARINYAWTIAGKVSLYTSQNGVDWTWVYTINDTPVSTGGGWYRTYFYAATDFEVGVRYVKIEISNDSLIYTPQIGSVQVYCNLVNFFANPEFETGNLTNWIAAPDYSLETSIAYKGFYSVKVAGNNDWSGLSQAIAVKPQTNYILSFYGKCNSNSVYKLMNQSQSDIAVAYTSNNNTWTKYSLTFNSGSNTSIIFYFGEYGGTNYLDSFSFYENPTNLLANPGFETGNFSQWCYASDCSITDSEKHSGSYSVKIVGNNDWSGINQAIPVKANTDYTLSFYGKCNSTSVFKILNPSWNDIAFAYTLNNNIWTIYSFTFNSESNTSVIFYFGEYGGTNYLDDFEIK